MSAVRKLSLSELYLRQVLICFGRKVLVKMEFNELAAVCCSGKIVVSIVGAGGKTTLMYLLAEECSRRGKRVLVSTTTHIWKPEESYAEDFDQVINKWRRGTYGTVGRLQPDGKLIQPEEEDMQDWMNQADLVLLEADGSKGLPCKVPAAHEPAIHPSTDLVIGVMGMSCMGQKLKDCCFRWQEAPRFLPVTGETRMDPKTAAAILLSENGTRKNVGDREYAVVLNQCDTMELQKAAAEISDKLKEMKDINRIGIMIR